MLGGLDTSETSEANARTFYSLFTARLEEGAEKLLDTKSDHRGEARDDLGGFTRR